MEKINIVCDEANFFTSLTEIDAAAIKFLWQSPLVQEDYLKLARQCNLDDTAS